MDILTKGVGQKKQARKNRGRPSGSTTIAHIRCLAHNQPSYVDSTDEVEYLPRDRESTGETSLHCTGAQRGVDTRAEQPAPCTTEEKTAK